ncbi:hypothetical protein, partial [Xanthomonas nasturtii]|uniref:hypothetical protein n=2 Tax=Xanthomonas nasturtii TaxID=1843581 RepID=UPI002012E86F
QFQHAENAGDALQWMWFGGFSGATNESTAIEVPKDVHKESPTYKGRNTPSQIEKDASDLCAAACRDINDLRTNLLKRGYDKSEIEAAVEKIVRRNQEIGIK